MIDTFTHIVIFRNRESSINQSHFNGKKNPPMSLKCIEKLDATAKKNFELKLTLPSVRTYISLTALVERFFKGSPLKPPPSFLFSLFKDDGRFIVVLVTINPSTRV